MLSIVDGQNSAYGVPMAGGASKIAYGRWHKIRHSCYLTTPPNLQNLRKLFSLHLVLDVNRLRRNKT